MPNLVDGCDLTPVCGNGNRQPAYEWLETVGGGMFEKIVKSYDRTGSHSHFFYLYGNSKSEEIGVM